VSRGAYAILIGGPFGGRHFSYPDAPHTLVMTQLVETPDAVMPGLRYHDYHRDDRRRATYNGRPSGPVYYVHEGHR
jgi:hypothetical protein